MIVDLAPRSGAWNMAVDEALLTSALEQALCTLRWYCWSEPTISLGYFQEASSVPPTAWLQGLPVVRRLSGGGAIVHDRELTYSLAVPAAHPLSSAPRDLYGRVHQEVIRGLAECGFAAALRGEKPAESEARFLCFERRDDFDVVCGDVKILGSAQRRRKGAILQHGSLVLRRSAHAPGFPGLYDLAGREIPLADLAAHLSGRVGALLSEAPLAGCLTGAEVALAERLERGFDASRGEAQAGISDAGAAAGAWSEGGLSG